MSSIKNNILIIKHGALGDIILAGAAIKAIRSSHKNDYIICLTTILFKDLLKKSPWIDMVIVDVKPKWNNIKGWKNLKDFFKKYNFSRVYDLQTSYRSNLYFYIFFFIKKTDWSGIALGSRFRQSNPNRKKMHTIDRQKDQLKLVGIDYNYYPEWKWLSNNYKNINIVPSNKFIILVIGAAKHRLNKRWPKENYALLIEYFANIGIQSVILGGHDEIQDVKEIINLVDKSIVKSPLNYANKTSYKDIAYLSSFAVYAIGNDTGPMHLIAACGLPVVVLFGSGSNPDLCAPKGSNVTILYKELIDNITVKSVFNAIKLHE